MKIGIVCYPTYGGSGIIATKLGTELAKENKQIHFISSSKPVLLNITFPNIFFHQVKVYSYPLFKYIPYGIALFSTITEVVKKYDLDIIHVHYAIPHAYHACIATKILKEQGKFLPLITTLHGTDITILGKNPAYKNGIEFSINNSDYITSVSNSLKKNTLEIFNINKEIITIPNFIDHNINKKKTIYIRDFFAKQNEKILIHVSNLRPIKRVTDVIEIFKRVEKKINSKLIIIGEGPEISNIKHLIQLYKLKNKVKLLGIMNQLYKILYIADLFLLPSKLESFGLAALEAMSNSVPVISTNTGGLPEVITHGFSGFLEKVGDIKSMSDRAIELLSDENKLKQFKKNAYIDSQRFSTKIIIPKYKTLYEKALKHI